MKRQSTTVVVAAVATMVAALTSATAATAAPPSPLDQCVSAAVERQLDNWTCLGGTVTYLAPADDASASADAAVSPAALPASDPGTVWATEVIVPDRPVVDREKANGGVTTMGNGDAWDVWCEYASTCTRRVSAYVSETKGNLAYGDGDQAIGTFDIMLKTNLNGGQPRYNVGFNVDTGPNMHIYADVNCVWDKLFDGTCGHFDVPDLYIGNYRGPIIYGNRVPSSGTYFSTITGIYEPDGWGQHAMPTLYSASFKCTSVSSCTFP